MSAVNLISWYHFLWVEARARIAKYTPIVLPNLTLSLKKYTLFRASDVAENMRRMRGAFVVVTSYTERLFFLFSTLRSEEAIH